MTLLDETLYRINVTDDADELLRQRASIANIAATYKAKAEPRDTLLAAIDARLVVIESLRMDEANRQFMEAANG